MAQLAASELHQLPAHRGLHSPHNSHSFDACLSALEEAHLGGEVAVSETMATQFSAGLPWLAPGMLVRDAIDGVFLEQARWLGTDDDADEAPVRIRRQPMAGDQARALTDRIKLEIRNVCVLLLEAHDRRAWSALDYSSWERYVKVEFGLSRSRSYELLDQGRVLRAIRSAAALAGVPDISAHAAGQIKHRLTEVLSEIRRRLALADGAADPAMVIADVIRAERRRRRTGSSDRLRVISAVPRAGGSANPRFKRDALKQLETALAGIASLPPPELLAAELKSESGTGALRSLGPALQWLRSLSNQLQLTSPAVGQPMATARGATR